MKIIFIKINPIKSCEYTYNQNCPAEINIYISFKNGINFFPQANIKVTFGKDNSNSSRHRGNKKEVNSSLFLLLFYLASQQIVHPHWGEQSSESSDSIANVIWKTLTDMLRNNIHCSLIFVPHSQSGLTLV